MLLQVHSRRLPKVLRDLLCDDETVDKVYRVPSAEREEEANDAETSADSCSPNWTHSCKLSAKRRLDSDGRAEGTLVVDDTPETTQESSTKLRERERPCCLETAAIDKHDGKRQRQRKMRGSTLSSVYIVNFDLIILAI